MGSLAAVAEAASEAAALVFSFFGWPGFSSARHGVTSGSEMSTNVHTTASSFVIDHPEYCKLSYLLDNGDACYSRGVASISCQQHRRLSGVERWAKDFLRVLCEILKGRFSIGSCHAS